MGHGSYNSIHTPWPMGRAMVHPLHGSWIVQWYAYPMGHGPYNGSASMHAPMGHGSYNSIHTPWPMDRATVHIPHGSWIVQQYAYPMGHGLYSG